MNAQAAMANGGWEAGISLSFGAGERGTTLDRMHHHGPLRVQRPFYPEGPACCHTYLLHPPGGMVSGDRLDIDIVLQDGAHALLTTPSAGKIYRGDQSGRSQYQGVKVDAGAGAVVEWLPQETILFDGARGELETSIQLSEGARCAVWDIVCLGRPACHETFTRGHLAQKLLIQSGKRPLFIERNRFDGGSSLLTGMWGLANQVVSGTFVQTLDLSDERLMDLREQLHAVEADRFVVTRLQGLLVTRYLGSRAELCRKGFEQVWQENREAMTGMAASPPRIWRT